MNTDKLTAFVQKHGIKVAIIGGGGVLLASNYGSCELSPPAVEEEVPAEVEDAAPEEEAAAEEAEASNEAEEASEEAEEESEEDGSSAE